MKVKFNTNLLVNVVIVVIVLFIVFNQVAFYLGPMVFSTTSRASRGDNYSYNTLNPFDPEISDSISYAKYQALKQNNEVVRDLKNGVWPHASSTKLGWVLATDGGLFCDTCTVYRPIDHGKFMPDPGTLQCYLKLPAWQLNPTPNPAGHSEFTSQFHVEHGQSYVRKYLSEKVLNKGSKSDHVLQQVDVPVKFRYNSKENAMLIPVSLSTKEIVGYVLLGIGCLIAAWFYYLIASFFKFIIDISKGLTFTAENVKRLRLIGFSLIGFPVLTTLLPFVPRIIFSSYFTNDIVLNKEIWNQSWQFLGAGVVFLLLFKAFSQGKALKEEQELTI